jgi:putative transposase
MAYLPRYLIVEDGSTFHMTWKCHNHSWLLKEEWAKQLYYNLLLKYKKRYGVKIHSYCFMSNHPHLTGTMSSKEKFSAFFRLVNSQFARGVNQIKKRRGQVVMDRFKSPRIQTDRDHLQVIIYGDLNPSRAGMVDHPKEYRWSSYLYYACGKEDPLIDPPPCYLQLGNNPTQRQEEYRLLVTHILQKEGLKKKTVLCSILYWRPCLGS